MRQTLDAILVSFNRRYRHGERRIVCGGSVTSAAARTCAAAHAVISTAHQVAPHHGFADRQNSQAMERSRAWVAAVRLVRAFPLSRRFPLILLFRCPKGAPEGLPFLPGYEVDYLKGCTGGLKEVTTPAGNTYPTHKVSVKVC